MQREETPGTSFAESQFYARTSQAPRIKRRERMYRRSDDIYPSIPLEEAFHDATDNLQVLADHTIDSKRKRFSPLYIGHALPFERVITNH
jgi:hypothetical protein